MSVSNGILAKTQQIHNNVVREKAVSVSIVDRFRAMLNEKEERLRVFDSPLSTDEIVRIFEIFLLSLTLNSKPIITDLTIIAGEQRVHCQGIADAICDRIIEVPVDRKLPSMYLLDSIMKNIGKEYIRHFSARLPEVFCDTYVQVDPSMQRAMRHLFDTWATVFSPSVLHKIETQLQFSPSLNAQSSPQNSLRVSQSPRPSNGIHVHVNPKYMDAKSLYGSATVNTIVAEGASSSGLAALKTSSLDSVKKPLLAANMVPKYASPYRTGHGSPSSSSHEEYTVDSSTPRRIPIRASPSHVPIDSKTDREETDEWKARNKDLKTSNVDLRGPRALINRYGIDKREKNLKRKHQQSDVNSANQKIRMAWQSTEEEEFDWEEDRKQGSESYSSIQPPGNLTVRQGFTTKYAAPLASDYEGNLSKAPSFVPDLSIVDKITHANAVRTSVKKTVGILPNVTRESLIIPSQKLSHLNAKGGPFSAKRSFLTAGEQQVFGNLPNGKLGDTSANLRNLHLFPSVSLSPPQMQITGQFGMNHAANNIVDPRLNKPFHPEQHLENSSNLLHIPSNRLPGTVPLPLQTPARVSQMRSNPLMSNEIRTNVLLPSIQTGPSHQMMPPPPYGYGTAFPSFIPVPNTRPTPPLNIAHISTPVNPQSTGALSGLVSSLVAQGLISLNKQVSIGLEFDPDSLEVRHELAVTALYKDIPRQCTTCGLRFKYQEEHSKHMDWHVNKNRTLRNRKRKPSPKWFVSVNMWLIGGFLPVDNKEMAVIADEAQNTCALCGEHFDDFYCDKTEEWMYKGAVYMDAPTGLAVGIDRSRSLVHVKCRPDSHGVTSGGSYKG